MSRTQKLKSFACGFGALGGTVAVIATVIEYYHGERRDWSGLKLTNKLLAETCEDTRPEWPKWDHNWDKRAPKEQKDENNNNLVEKVKATRNIILIRHGQYNLEGTVDRERYLTGLGREQAEGTGARLAQLSLPYTHILHSNMTRAIETAELISKSLPQVPVLEADSLLREGSPIKPEPLVSSWRPDHYYLTDGARIEAAFRNLFHRADPSQKEDSFEIVVCHANVIRYFVCRALQFPPEAWLRMSLKHASLTWFVIRPDGRVSSRCIGEAGHFPPEMLTTS